MLLILLFSIFTLSLADQSAKSEIKISINFNNETNIQDYEINFDSKMKDSEKRIIKINNANYSIELQNFLQFQQEKKFFSLHFIILMFAVYGFYTLIIKIYKIHFKNLNLKDKITKLINISE